jgi:hypothetical protein
VTEAAHGRLGTRGKQPSTSHASRVAVPSSSTAES